MSVRDKRDVQPHISYASSGVPGHWNKRTWGVQCLESAGLFERCMGVVGHKGDHWRYADDGAYEYAVNKADPESVARNPNTACGMVPPEHQNWISPITKAPEKYLRFFVDEPVTDPVLIAKLEADEYIDGATLDRPCTADEIEELRQLGALEGLDI